MTLLTDTHAAPGADHAARSVGRWSRRWADPRFRAAVGCGLPLVVCLVHIGLIAPHYFIGSFDDDASYIMGAKALAAGKGLTGHVASGAPVIGLYPPGYSALLVPLVWLWPHTYAPLRLFSAACVAALFPLLWVLLGRRGMRRVTRSVTLLLLALTPVLATYGSMVMAEAPYLVVLLVLLLLVDRWDQQERTWTCAGVGVAIASAALVWLKFAGAAALAGLVVYLVLRSDARGRVRRAALVVTTVAVSMIPIAIARIATNTPVLGARYGSTLNGYGNSIGSRGQHMVADLPGHIWTLVAVAVPDTLDPYRSPLPDSAFLRDIAWQIFALQMVVVMGIGMLWWWHRYRDATVAVVAVYLLIVAFWPDVNERRSILVVPFLVVWYVVGAATIGRFVRARAEPRWLWPSTVWSAGVVIVLTVAMLIPQLPRDYLFGLGQDTSRFAGSRYVALLSHLGTPSDVVETDYRSSTALFTGHRTAWTAFAPSALEPCNFAGITADDAGYMLLGDVNHAGVLDSPCLQAMAATGTWAVELLHTSRDNATVYELIGPGTAHPDLTDLTRSTPKTTSRGGQTVVEWEWPTAKALEQVSVGEASLAGGSTTSVVLEVRGTTGTWIPVASSSAAVGDGAGDVPFLLATGPGAEPVTGVRVVLTGSSSSANADVTDVAALGPAA